MSHVRHVCVLSNEASSYFDTVQGFASALRSRKRDKKQVRGSAVMSWCCPSLSLSLSFCFVVSVFSHPLRVISKCEHQRIHRHYVQHVGQAPNEGTSPCYAEEAMTRTPKAGSCCCASCFRLVGGTTIAFCMANALDILFPREVHLKLTTMQPSSGFSSELCSLFILFLSPHFSS